MGEKSVKLKKDSSIAILAFLIYTISMIAVVVAKVVFKDLYLGCCIIIGIGMIAYIFVVTRIDGDYEELKNRAILVYSGVTKYIFLFGVTFENKLFVKEALYENDSPLTYVAYLIAPVLVAIELYMYIKNKKSANLRKYILVTFLIIYYMGLMNISSHWIIMLIVPILTAYTGFQDTKLVILGSGCISLMAIFGAMRHIHFWETKVVGDMVFGIPRALKYFINVRSTEETGYLRWTYIVFVLFIIFFGFVTIIVTKNIKMSNEEKIESVEAEQDKIEKLINKIIEIGMKIKTSAFNTNNIVNELDKIIDNSSEVLSEVDNNNKENSKGIEHQTRMNINISNLINDLVIEVKKATTATLDSLKVLENSRYSFEDLKNKSDKIYYNNKEVINVIDEFVETAKEVRNITSGIANISDETNLLALNASIKSARAGEVGKGFAVVANQVRQLAVETSSLTEMIDELVEELEGSAFISQKAINEVVSAINDENSTIDGTIADFENMQKNIHGLSNNMKGISISVEELTRFNDEIEKHINELGSLNSMVSSNTKSAEISNENNKEKIAQTRELMNEILMVSEKLDEFFYTIDRL